MKQFRIIIIALLGGLLFLLYGCPYIPWDVEEECTYEYSLNITNLADTIKTTDTLWVENDFDPHFCLSEGVYKNGVVEESPYFMKLINDSLIFYTPIVVNYTKKREVQKGEVYYVIEIREQNSRYKSAKYGIVFPETGVYLLSRFGGLLINGKESPLRLKALFNTSTNNNYLLPESLQELYSNRPYHNYGYFIAVVK
jgi:hypothetical protein